jgi:hypothetical protein
LPPWELRKQALKSYVIELRKQALKSYVITIQMANFILTLPIMVARGFGVNHVAEIRAEPNDLNGILEHIRSAQRPELVARALRESPLCEVLGRLTRTAWAA